MSEGARLFTELRAWQTCLTYKRAVYRLILDSPLVKDWSRREQLEKSVAGPPAHLSEGFARFNPPDFARYTVFARGSLAESQNHLLDAVDKGYITEEQRQDLNALAEVALQEVTALMDYLLSPEAARVSGISCVGHSMRSRHAPQTEIRKAERRGPGADPC